MSLSCAKETVGNGDVVRFGRTEDAYDNFAGLLKDLIKRHGCLKVADVGGGAEPQLTVEEVEAMALDYTLVDISAGELELAPAGFRKLVMDIAGPLPAGRKGYDLLFSRFVMEHVRDAAQAHENVYALLKPGGIAVHFFPTLYALPFLINKLLPESLSVRFLSKKRQERGKFPAYYHWCVGPSDEAVKRFERMGYKVVEYSGFYGHGYYDRVPLLRNWQRLVRDLLLRFRVVSGTSFAWVVLQKPLESRVDGA